MSENETPTSATETTAQPPAEAPAPATENTHDSPATDKTPSGKAAKWHRIGGIALDTFLVLLLVAAIGATGLYLKKQFYKYRVPTPMELAMRENERLCKRYEELRETAFRAEERIQMRRRLAHLDSTIGKRALQIADLEASINEQRNRILAIQHEIRATDKEYRNVARSLLPGLPIGNATTTNGKVYRNATIYRIEPRNIVLRTPDGQSRIPQNILVKDNLPTIARYAFGVENLVDMSDFDTSESIANLANRQPEEAAEQPAPVKAKRKPASYEPESGAPVVDTDASSTATSGGSDAADTQTDDGLAPW